MEGNHGGGSDDQGDGPFTVDEDMETSPTIPPSKFPIPDNVKGYAGCEGKGDSIWLRCKL